MNATRGTRFILKTLQEVRVIEKFAVQDLERHGAITHPNLLGEENRAHAPFAQTADKAKPAGQSGGKLGLGLRGWGGKASAVVRTELDIIGVGLLTSVANLHERH
jgi:hypothetical protein